MKILVIYATAGAGHLKAAEAIDHGLRRSASHTVTLADSLDYTNPVYKSLYSGFYTFLITKIPWLWGAFFGFVDLPWIAPVGNIFRRAHNAFHGRGLAQFLQKEQFDYIITTHFFPNEVASYLKKQGLIRSKIISCITDFDVHRIWLGEAIDHYAVACDATAKKLLQLRVAPEKIAITGIPVHAKFSESKDKAALRRKLGLQDGVLTVLVATGSFGLGPIGEIIRIAGQYQLLVVCGHNRRLYERLVREQKGLVKIFGLVNNMDELMAVSDLMVTKPGGLSISEALVRELPLIFFSAIPGQETNNMRVLSQYGVGRNLGRREIHKLEDILRRLSTSPGDLEQIKKKAKTLGRPSAVQDIIALIR